MADPSASATLRGHFRNTSPQSGMLTVLVVVVLIAVLYFAQEVFIPIVLAILLSFLLGPAVRRLQRLQIGRVAAVGVTVLVAFLAILGFGAVVAQEVSSLARELPNYRYNLETKIRSLPGFVPGGGVFQRASDMLRELRHELTKSEGRTSPSQAPAAAAGASSSDATKPVPVQIEEPEPGPLQIVQSIVGP